MTEMHSASLHLFDALAMPQYNQCVSRHTLWAGYAIGGHHDPEKVSFLTWRRVFQLGEQLGSLRRRKPCCGCGLQTDDYGECILSVGRRCEYTPCAFEIFACR